MDISKTFDAQRIINWNAKPLRMSLRCWQIVEKFFRNRLKILRNSWNLIWWRNAIWFKNFSFSFHFRSRASRRCRSWLTQTSHFIGSRTEPSQVMAEKSKQMDLQTLQCGPLEPSWIIAQSIQLWRWTKARHRQRTFFRPATKQPTTTRCTNGTRHTRRPTTIPTQVHIFRRTMDRHWSSSRFRKTIRMTHQANRWVIYDQSEVFDRKKQKKKKHLSLRNWFVTFKIFTKATSRITRGSGNFNELWNGKTSKNNSSREV